MSKTIKNKVPEWMRCTLTAPIDALCFPSGSLRSSVSLRSALLPIIFPATP